MGDESDRVLDVLASASAVLAPETRCDHRWAFVPPARFNRPGASLPSRCDHYTRYGVRIYSLCGAWAYAEPGDLDRYERKDLKDIPVY